MAVIATPLDSRLRLVLEIGEDDNGKIILATRNYSKVKPEAEDEEVFEVAGILQSLQQYPAHLIKRVNETKLDEI